MKVTSLDSIKENMTLSYLKKALATTLQRGGPDLFKTQRKDCVIEESKRYVTLIYHGRKCQQGNSG